MRFHRHCRKVPFHDITWQVLDHSCQEPRKRREGQVCFPGLGNVSAEKNTIWVDGMWFDIDLMDCFLMIPSA